jgi:hypothetical protein
MKWVTHLLVLLGASVLLGGTVWVYQDGLAPSRPGPSGGGGLTEESQRSKDLEARRQFVLWRNQQQAQVVQDLVAGRCTLLTAAGRFRDLYKGDAVVDNALRDTYPAPTEVERVCLWVIAYTETDQEGKDGMAALVERLKKEMQEHLKRGTLRLPE